MHNFILKVEELVDWLRSIGLPVQSFTNGDDLVDGEVILNDAVSIQVPFCSNPSVVIEDGGKLIFKRPAQSWLNLNLQLTEAFAQ